jgi:hypothetical protein
VGAVVDLPNGKVPNPMGALALETSVAVISDRTAEA